MMASFPSVARERPGNEASYKFANSSSVKSKTTFKRAALGGTRPMTRLSRQSYNKPLSYILCPLRAGISIILCGRE